MIAREKPHVVPPEGGEVKMRYPMMLTVAAASVAGVGAALAASRTAAVAPPPVRSTYDPFVLQRAAQAPGTPANAALQRRDAIVKWLAANRVLPPAEQHSRSPFRPGPPATTPPPFTPPGGGTGTNPGGNTPGGGNGNGNGPKK
jgi:hypothetical protein